QPIARAPSRLRQPGHRLGCSDSGASVLWWCYGRFRGARRKRISTFGRSGAGLSDMVTGLRDLPPQRAPGDPGPEARHEGDRMSRTRILVAGGLLWTVAIVDGLAHVVSGDLL